MPATCSTPPALTAEQIARFWSHVATAGPDECWPWVGHLNDHGYAYYRVGTRKFRAHILARYLATGEWPGELCTLHDCPAGDNPACVNPAHLWLGTQAENMRDMVEKGRNRPNQVRGERQGQAKLTAESVLEIRRLYDAGGVTLKELSGRFGISLATTHLVTSRSSWRHLP